MVLTSRPCVHAPREVGDSQRRRLTRSAQQFDKVNAAVSQARGKSITRADHLG